MTNQCFCCGGRLNPLFEGSTSQYQYSGATTFYAPGNYGSGLHDPIGGNSRLMINICDVCLRGNKDRVLQETLRRPVQARFSYEPWELAESEESE
jgi:hypothetical protein